MMTAVIALTKNGSRLACRVGKRLGADIYLKQEFAVEAVSEGTQTVSEITGGFTSFIGELMKRYEGLIFIMACGIVVRAVAPHLEDKTSDPAVVVMDEKGRYAVSLLSGHIGGANALAEEVALVTSGQAVITTATDVNGVISFDVFAKENDLIIENIGELKYISSELANGGKVGLLSDKKVVVNTGNVVRVGMNPEENFTGNDKLNNHVVLSSREDIRPAGGNVLYLRPRCLVLGIGCKKGVAAKDIRNAVEDFMMKNNRSIFSLKCAATVEIKRDEPGIVEFCREQELELKIVFREEIKKVEDSFSSSAFVRKNIGVGSVAEPCSVLAVPGARLICPKTVYSGITLALSETDREYSLGKKSFPL